jgi:hypothetical protein
VNALRKIVAAREDFDLKLLERDAVQFNASVSLVPGALHLGGGHGPLVFDVFFGCGFHLTVNTEAKRESFKIQRTRHARAAS